LWFRSDSVETFPSYSPEYGTEMTTKSRIIEMKFGDGYSQRASDGINGSEISFPLVFNLLSSGDAETILAFLEARGGYEAFLWTPPGTSTPLKWICREWRYRPEPGGRATISATFERVYDL